MIIIIIKNHNLKTKEEDSVIKMNFIYLANINAASTLAIVFENARSVTRQLHLFHSMNYLNWYWEQVWNKRLLADGWWR